MLFSNVHIDVAKKIRSGDKDVYTDNLALKGARMNIQPATPEITVLVEGAFGKTYTGFTSVSGIDIGDKVTVSGTSKVYYVKGVSDWNQAPLPHWEYTLVSET